jgi:hypothetical protein
MLPRTTLHRRVIRLAASGVVACGALFFEACGGAAPPPPPVSGSPVRALLEHEPGHVDALDLQVADLELAGVGGGSAR